MSDSLTENIEDKYNLNLIDALAYGCLDQANALIRAGVGLNARDKNRRTALMIALAYGCINQANALIDAGVDLNVIDKDGRTALMIALAYGRQEIIKKLKETNSSFNLFLIIIGMTGEGLNIITQMDSFVEVIIDIRDFME